MLPLKRLALNMARLWTTLILLNLLPQLISAQQAADTSVIYLIHADTQVWELRDRSTVQIYTGNVLLYQDSVFMYADSAYIQDSIYLSAYGHVLIQHEDSVQVFADTLIYQGVTRNATLYGDIVLVNGGQKLYTNYLEYNLDDRIAHYTKGATLTDDETTLTSKSGHYEVDLDLAHFKDSVEVIGQDFYMRMDSMAYQTKDKIAYFLGPTLLQQQDKRIYCESGYYNVQEQVAEFSDHAQYEEGDRRAEADIIRYEKANYKVILDGEARIKEEGREAKGDHIEYLEDKEWFTIDGHGYYTDSSRTVAGETIFYDVKQDSFALPGRSTVASGSQHFTADRMRYSKAQGNGVAAGDVIWIDTTQQYVIESDSLSYGDKPARIEAIGLTRRPLLIAIVDGDSLFIKADSLRFTQVSETDTSKIMRAFHRVKMYKSDMQAVCDSLVYRESDSVFILYRQPILWADTSQFTADTIEMRLRNKKLDLIYLKQNAFIVNTTDEVFFNQIKGRTIQAHLTDNELDRMDIVGNAETIYYVQDDDKAYIGVNKAVCSRIRVFFGNNAVDRIRMYQDPSGQMTPMDLFDHEANQLEGFIWNEDKRPKNKSEL